MPAAAASPAGITGQATGPSGAAVSPHGRMERRGWGFHTAGSCPAGRGGGGVPRPFSRGAARACSRAQGAGPAGLLHPLACFTCKLLPGDWLAGQRWGIVPPAVPARAGKGVSLAVGAGSGCPLVFRGLGHTKDPQGGRRCTHCSGLWVGTGDEKEDYDRRG